MLIISGTSSLGQPIISRALLDGFEVTASFRTDRKDREQEAVVWLSLDLANPDSIHHFLQTIEKLEFDRIIFLTGVLSEQDFLDVDLDSIRNYVAIQLANPAFLLSRLMHNLKENGGIIILTSRSARNASFDALYAMAKGGLQSLALSLGLRMKKGQSVVCIAPSLIRNSTMYLAMSQETHSKHLARARGNLLEIDEVAEFIWGANPKICEPMNGRTLEIGHEI